MGVLNIYLKDDHGSIFYSESGKFLQTLTKVDFDKDFTQTRIHELNNQFMDLIDNLTSL